MNMNLTDRVALILGRAIIRAEEMAVLAEQAQAHVAELEAEKNTNCEQEDGECP